MGEWNTKLIWSISIVAALTLTLTVNKPLKHIDTQWTRKRRQKRNFLCCLNFFLSLCLGLWSFSLSRSLLFGVNGSLNGIAGGGVVTSVLRSTAGRQGAVLHAVWQRLCDVVLVGLERLLGGLRRRETGRIQNQAQNYTSSGKLR